MARGGARPGAGRKPGVRNRVTKDIKELAQSYGEDAIRRLAILASDDSIAPAAQVAAIKELLDRGYGKATQPIAGDPDMPPVGIFPTAIELVAPGHDESED